MDQTNAQRRRAHAEQARAKAALMRAEQARSERRRRVIVLVSSVLAVLLVIAGVVTVGVLTKRSSAAKAAAASGRSPVAASVVAKASSVPASVLSTIGQGTAKPLPTPIKGTPATGKPYLLYVGGEYCPYCAAERWALVVALARFGTFSNLGETTSSAQDVFPSTPTFTFYQSSFSSPYVDFVGKEIYSNKLQGNNYAPLETLTTAESDIFKKFSYQQAFPFFYIDGKFVVTGVQYDPSVLKGLSMAQVADQLATPTSKVAQAIDGAANTITAAVCKATGAKPAAVCTAPEITALQAKLGG